MEFSKVGKITKILTGKRQAKRVNIYVDGHFALSLDAETALKEKLRVDIELGYDRIMELERVDEIKRAADTAVRLMGYRPRSETELRNHLERRGFPTDIVNDAVNRLKEKGLVDDDNFAHFWIENRESFNPRSRYMIARELKQKGLANEIIDNSIDGINDEENAYRIALTRINRLDKVEYRDFRRRLGGYLQRRGFSYDIINKITGKIWQEKKETGIVRD